MCHPAANTMLSVDQPDQTTCIREQFGEKKTGSNLASLDVTRKIISLHPQGLLHCLYYFLNNCHLSLKELSIISLDMTI